MEVTTLKTGEKAWINSVIRVIDKVGIFSRWINIIAAATILLVSGLLFVDVFMRVADHPIRGVTEIVEVMMVTAVFLGLAHTYNEKSHIGIDLITSKLSEKNQLVMGFITNLISTVLFSIIVWRVVIQTQLYAAKNVMHGYVAIPVTPFNVLIIIGCTLMVLLMIRDLLRDINTGFVMKMKWFQWLLMGVVPVAFIALAIWWAQPDMWNISMVTVGLIGIVVSLVLLLTGMPISFALLVTSFLFISHIRGFPTGFDILGTSMYRTTGNFMWSVVAFFVLMGYFCLHVGFGKDLYRAAYRWVGNRMGGLAMATVAACTGFAAIVGDTLSAVVTFGSLALPEMRQYRYDDRLSTAAIIGGAALGPLIPPSMGAILYGLLTSVSIGKLFMAIIIPGLILSVSFIIIIIIWCRKNPNLGPRGESFGWKPRFQSLGSITPVAILAIVVVGGIYTGMFSPSEGGAMGAFVAVIIGLVMGRVTRKNLTESLLATAKVVSMFFMLFIGAVMFSQFMAWCNITKAATTFINDLGLPALGVELFIVAIMYFLGFFIDSGPLMLVGVPIAFPIADALGADPIWFAVNIILAVTLGMITPPVALNIFALKGIAKDIPIGVMYRGIMPFVAISLVVLALVFFVPSLSTWLPYLMS